MYLFSAKHSHLIVQARDGGGSSVKKSLGVIGAGYVGLVTAVCLAKKGHSVVVVERDPARREMLHAGIVPFFEPGLDQLLKQVIDYGDLIVESSVEDLFQKYQPEIVFSCVGTPSLSDGGVDLSDVWSVVREVSHRANHSFVLVHKSTVPVGVCRNSDKLIKEQLANRDVDIVIDVASNPEFLREGQAVHDFMHPDRVVIGVSSESAAQALHRLYQDYVSSDDQIVVMGRESSELTKYGANTMLAARISLVNELAQLADKVGADINAVTKGMGLDTRIGKEFLQAGLGYGGSCFPKDVSGLIHQAKAVGIDPLLSQSIEDVNKNQTSYFVSKIHGHYGTELSSKKVGIWGLAFKPGTDDVRQAPAARVIELLQGKVASIKAYDPVAMDSFARNNKDLELTYASDARDVLMTSDFLIICTQWPQFVGALPEDFGLLADKTIFDGRNIFDPQEMATAGLCYFSMGRACSLSHIIQEMIPSRQQLAN
jgi:UDPglucose 6-dehydrogenase